jgi:hypothetical protein
MEKVILTKEEFDALGEYSCSLPTGTTLGKIWKYNRLAYAPSRFTNPKIKIEDWYMGEYAPDPKAKMGKDGLPQTVLIVWRKIEIQ